MCVCLSAYARLYICFGVRAAVHATATARMDKYMKNAQVIYRVFDIFNHFLFVFISGLLTQGDMRAKYEMRARNVAGNSPCVCVCVCVRIEMSKCVQNCDLISIDYLISITYRSHSHCCCTLLRSAVVHVCVCVCVKKGKLN